MLRNILDSVMNDTEKEVLNEIPISGWQYYDGDGGWQVDDSLHVRGGQSMNMFSNDLQQTEGLGMIILEGSHKVLGKGIFVTDIQKGSLAMRVSIDLSRTNENFRLWVRFRPCT